MSSLASHDYDLHRLLKGVLLILVAALSAWLVQVTEPPLEVVEQPVRHDPDYFAERFTTTIIDAKGQIHHRLRADFLKHFPDDDSSDLQHPYFTLFREGSPSWLINSERGRVGAGGETVWLFGQVQVRQPPGFDAWEMDTSEMLLRPEVQYGETERAVEIRHPPWQVVDAVGMRVHLKDKQVELLSNVRGRYEAPFPDPSSR
ncbi:lipopolysaccharide export system protein LptC [Gammaproteobacteria bacterium]